MKYSAQVAGCDVRRLLACGRDHPPCRHSSSYGIKQTGDSNNYDQVRFLELSKKRCGVTEFSKQISKITFCDY